MFTLPDFRFNKPFARKWSARRSVLLSDEMTFQNILDITFCPILRYVVNMVSKLLRHHGGDLRNKADLFNEKTLQSLFVRVSPRPRLRPNPGEVDIFHDWRSVIEAL
jgi:hypothetical protein